MGASTSSERQKAANSLNKRQDLLQALIKLHSPARSAWFPLQGRASKAARVDPESLKDGSDEMVIKFTDRQGVKREVGVQVISGEGTVQQRVKQMGERALKELGVPSAPRIDHYTPPFLSQALIVALAISFQAYVVFSPDPTRADGPHRSVGTAVKAWLNKLPYGEWIVPGSVVFLVVAHALEALYIDSQAAKHRVPPAARLAWDLTTFFFGFPSMNQFRNQVQRERVRLVGAASR